MELSKRDLVTRIDAIEEDHKIKQTVQIIRNRKKKGM